MKRVWGHVLAGFAVMTGAAAVSTACAHDDSSLFVLDVLAQQLVSNGMQCVYTTDPTQPYISGGILDLSLRTRYDAEYLVGNDLVQQGNPDQFRSETSRVHVETAIVSIQDTSGNQLNTYTYDVASTIEPSTGTTPSFEPISVNTIDHATATGLLGKVSGGTVVPINTYVRFTGHTLGGQYVESNNFEFTVDVCYGCLLGVGMQDISGMGSSGTQQPLPCVPGQDVTIDACQCTEPICCQICPISLCAKPITDGGTGG
jgi:hypothetical protein